MARIVALRFVISLIKESVFRPLFRCLYVHVLFTVELNNFVLSTTQLNCLAVSTHLSSNTEHLRNATLLTFSRDL